MALPPILSQNIPTGGNALSVPRFKQNQNDFYDQLLNYSMNKLQNPTQGFGPIAEQARSQFSQRTVPEILERFTSSGDNRLSSGVLGSQLGAASADLERNLAALQSQYGQQNEQLGLQYANLGLTPQYETSLQASPWQGVAGGLLQQAPQWAELGLKGYKALKSNPAQTANAANAGTTAGNIASAVGGTTGLASLASNFGGVGSAISSGLAAAAPFALPAAGAAAVIGLPFLLSYLLED